jgi:hypothetical protein
VQVEQFVHRAHLLVEVQHVDGRGVPGLVVGGAADAATRRLGVYRRHLDDDPLEAVAELGVRNNRATLAEDLGILEDVGQDHIGHVPIAAVAKHLVSQRVPVVALLLVVGEKAQSIAEERAKVLHLERKTATAVGHHDQRLKDRHRHDCASRGAAFSIRGRSTCHNA